MELKKRKEFLAQMGGRTASKVLLWEVMADLNIVEKIALSRNVQYMWYFYLLICFYMFNHYSLLAEGQQLINSLQNCNCIISPSGCDSPTRRHHLLLSKESLLSRSIKAQHQTDWAWWAEAQLRPPPFHPPDILQETFLLLCTYIYSCCSMIPPPSLPLIFFPILF